MKSVTLVKLPRRVMMPENTSSDNRSASLRRDLSESAVRLGVGPARSLQVGADDAPNKVQHGPGQRGMTFP